MTKDGCPTLPPVISARVALLRSLRADGSPQAPLPQLMQHLRNRHSS